MAKTNVPIEFKIPEKAEAILKSYHFLNHEYRYLLPILPNKKYNSETERKKAISSKNASFNRVLKIIAAPLKLNRTISMHSARHTFAVLALELKIPIEVVSNLLGHQNIKTTQVYATIVSPSKEEAINKLNTLT
jgi:site-specific recombinase XerD